jgi:hypothetical protein
VSHLSSRCSDLELGKKLLCVKLASTTEVLLPSASVHYCAG